MRPDDWSPEFEGIWGNKANGQMHVHPYTHHGFHAGLAITYKIPADGNTNSAPATIPPHVRCSSHPQ